MTVYMTQSMTRGSSDLSVDHLVRTNTGKYQTSMITLNEDLYHMVSNGKSYRT